MVTDSTHVKANVNDALRETVTVTKEPSEYPKALEATARELEAAADEKRQDLAHVTVEPTNGIVVDAMATSANQSDHEAYVGCIRRTKKQIEVEEAAADAGYDFISVHQTLTELGVTTYIAAVEHRSGTDDGNRFSVREFVYDPKTDTFQGPGGKVLSFTSVKDSDKMYRARRKDCTACPRASQCLSASAKYRRLHRPIHLEYLEAAHERNKTERYLDLMRKRRIWSEGTFAILKACHGMRRAIRRGLDNMQEQVLMASTALNIRRMVTAMK